MVISLYAYSTNSNPKVINHACSLKLDGSHRRDTTPNEKHSRKTLWNTNLSESVEQSKPQLKLRHIAGVGTEPWPVYESTMQCTLLYWCNIYNILVERVYLLY